MAGKKGISTLSNKQQAALAALVSQPTITLAAAKAKIGERTLYRWMAEDAAFKTEYLKLRRGVVNNAVFQLQKACNDAVATLSGIMVDSTAPTSARVTAAKEVLERSLKFLELEDLAARVALHR